MKIRDSVSIWELRCESSKANTHAVFSPKYYVTKNQKSTRIAKLYNI